MQHLPAALPPDNDVIQNCGHQPGVDVLPKRELPLQGGSDLLQPCLGEPALLRLLMNQRDLPLQLPELPVEAVVPLPELRRGECPRKAQLQQVILLGTDGGALRLQVPGAGGTARRTGGGPDQAQSGLNDSLLVGNRQRKNPGHDPVQLRRIQLRRGAGRPPSAAVLPALPHLPLPTAAFQQPAVEAGAVLLTEELAAVGIAVVKFRGALVGFHLLAAAPGSALDKLITLAVIVVAVAVYGVLLLALHAVEREDVLLLPKGEKIADILHLK